MKENHIRKIWKSKERKVKEHRKITGMSQMNIRFSLPSILAPSVFSPKKIFMNEWLVSNELDFDVVA